MAALPEEDRVLLGLLLAVLASIGVAMCAVEIYEVLQLKNILLFKIFGLSHALIHATAQIVVVIFFISSQMILSTTWVYPPLVGYVALALQFASLYTSIAMSINRLISVSFPTSYSKIFTTRSTVVIAILPWIAAFSTSSVLLIDDCNLSFNRSSGGFSFRDTVCGRVFSGYVDVLFNIFLVLIVVPLDIFSLLILNRITKNRALHTHRLQKEKPWFIQTLMNSLLFATMLAFFHATPLFSNEVVRFIFTVVSWEMWLLSPQVVGIIVQKECRSPYLRFTDKMRSKTMQVMPNIITQN